MQSNKFTWYFNLKFEILIMLMADHDLAYANAPIS